MLYNVFDVECETFDWCPDSDAKIVLYALNQIDIYEFRNFSMIEIFSSASGEVQYSCESE
jgi:hypothetical protein